MNIILPIKDIFIIAGNIVFSVLYNEHLEFPCRCQLLSSNSEVMQELYIEKELFIKRTTENDCRALVLEEHWNTYLMKLLLASVHWPYYKKK
ncbi:hypothetical protein ACPB1U_24920 [Escherichia coli]